jgi:hypothetical protein
VENLFADSVALKIISRFHVLKRMNGKVMSKLIQEMNFGSWQIQRNALHARWQSKKIRDVII